MARGWESKSVEAQQEEATRGTKDRRPSLTDEERARLERRGTLELARARAAADLSRAGSPAYRQMLQQTLDALDAQLAALDTV